VAVSHCQDIPVRFFILYVEGLQQDVWRILYQNDSGLRIKQFKFYGYVFPLTTGLHVCHKHDYMTCIMITICIPSGTACAVLSGGVVRIRNRRFQLPCRMEFATLNAV
jgi:hypothetical protein